MVNFEVAVATEYRGIVDIKYTCVDDASLADLIRRHAYEGPALPPREVHQIPKDRNPSKSFLDISRSFISVYPKRTPHSLGFIRISRGSAASFPKKTCLSSF